MIRKVRRFVAVYDHPASMIALPLLVFLDALMGRWTSTTSFMAFMATVIYILEACDRIERAIAARPLVRVVRESDGKEGIPSHHQAALVAMLRHHDEAGEWPGHVTGERDADEWEFTAHPDQEDR